MLPAGLCAAIEAAITAAATPFRIGSLAPRAGGCIHEAYLIEGGGERYFLKTNDAAFAACFAAEVEGLRALERAGVRVPRPLCQGSAAGGAFLVMEWLDLRGRGAGTGWAAMGSMLAALHRVSAPGFGWQRGNYIGATPQPNNEHAAWPDFWRAERLAPQLELARRNGLGSRLISSGERLGEAVPKLLAGHQPAPSLLHGDLWSGNAGFLADGAPVLYDPAVYFGDREADLAMSELFGGFAPDFRAAYRELWPLESGYELRADLYNLYHVLNHANLYGGGYGARARSMIDRLLSQVKR